MFVAIFVVALALIILIHELGHFVTARMCGMKAEKFFIGFGPTLWSTQRGETEVGVKWLPLGGFVKIAGMSPYEEYDEADRDRTYFAQPGWQRAIVISAGSITHFVMAAALLFAALAFIGLPPEDEPARNEIAQVVESSPAAEAGLEAGDEIVAVDGEPTGSFPALADQIEPRAGERVQLTVRGDGGPRQVTVTLGQHPERPDAGYLGFLPASPPREPLGAAEAAVSLVSGDRSLPRIATLSVTGIAEALSPQGLAEWFATFDEQQRSAQGPVSPVGAGQIVAALGDQGQIFGILLLLVQFNIIIGVLNMLPLPPLDGGHFAVVLVEGAVNTMRRARGVAGQYFVDPSRLTPLALLVILFFGTVFLSALYLDLVKPASQLVN